MQLSTLSSCWYSQYCYLITFSCEGKKNVIFRRLQHFIKYNGFIGVWMLNYFQIVVGIWIQLHYATFDSIFAIASFVTAVVFLIVFIVGPVMLSNFLDQSEIEFHDEDFKQDWAILYQRCDHKDYFNRHFLLQITLFKLLQTFIMINYSADPLTCLFFLFVVSIALWSEVLVLQPFSDPSENSLMLWSQASLILLYLLSVINEAANKSGIAQWFKISLIVTIVSCIATFATIIFLLYRIIEARKEYIVAAFNKVSKDKRKRATTSPDPQVNKSMSANYGVPGVEMSTMATMPRKTETMDGRRNSIERKGTLE